MNDKYKINKKNYNFVLACIEKFKLFLSFLMKFKFKKNFNYSCLFNEISMINK